MAERVKVSKPAGVTQLGAAGAATTEHKANSVNMPVELWRLLDTVAFKRKMAKGGRASVSAILTELVRKHEADLKAEIGQ
jgi:hypothetical protein